MKLVLTLHTKEKKKNGKKEGRCRMKKRSGKAEKEGHEDNEKIKKENKKLKKNPIMPINSVHW